ncbi:MAG TPA: arsenite methyltransferase [Syntrophales bacterium]|nr:arsenite methyltransferase [Syntrophales bacterium]HOL58764.1 arsenite methyltransferase [Syntrophales bacterium]HPO34948.1 arsenite methyltransferase [Syntrophales bacterium]
MEQKERVKESVKTAYGKIAKKSLSCCLPPTACSITTLTEKIGYREEDLQSVPEGANLGLGCGNPLALASLKEGDTVVDLGCGAGFDCFLAARKVGKKGRVIGIDMTQEMIEKAKANAIKGKYEQVEFRLGEIEYLPLNENTADVIISNCVINLSPDKERAFAEAFRVLKPGGFLHISDMVLNGELPPTIRDSMEAYIGCIAGAVEKEEYLSAIRKAGFVNIKVVKESAYPVQELLSPLMDLDETTDIKVISILVSAQKPMK